MNSSYTRRPGEVVSNTQPQFSIRLKLLLKISFELIRVHLDTHDGDDIGGMCACFFSIVPRFSQTADIPGRAPICGGRDTSSMADLYGSVRGRGRIVILLIKVLRHKPG